MASILFYTPFDQRSRDVESLMIAFHNQGHRVISLTQQKGSAINDFLKSRGIEAFSFEISSRRKNWWYFVRHLIYFIRFCYKHKVDVVYSHLESSNFVASIGQYFISAKTILCRHHIDEARLYGFDKALYYKITYRLAKNIIVESDHARRYMIAHEDIPEKKIIHINLAYDFALYPKVSNDNVTQLRNIYSCEILLLSVCRLTAFKRPDISVRILKKLVDKGLNAKLLILGKGEMQNDLESLIDQLELSGRAVIPGHLSNVIDYMKAADFLVHPSLLDSSSIVVKEAGLLSKPVIVCEGVGDFDDYIVNNENGFRLNQHNFETEAVELILKLHHNKPALDRVGGNLNRDVINLFSIENILPEYASLNKTDG